MEELEYIDLDLSFVLDWYKELDALVFELDVYLMPEHPKYQPLRKGEVGFYKKATLVFVAPRNVEGLLEKEKVKPNCDPDGTKDYGEMGDIAINTAGTFGMS